MKIIAVDIDDTLNTFSETLAQSTFEYNDSYGLSPETFEHYLHELKQNRAPQSDQLTSEFTYFRYRIYELCHQRASARPDAARFMNWLHANGWKIVICTQRDLRLATTYTRKWLHDNTIPFDYLFSALNKIVFCKLWNIPILIDDLEMNILYGAQYNIDVFYPIMNKHLTLPTHNAKGFHDFEEVQQWIQK